MQLSYIITAWFYFMFEKTSSESPIGEAFALSPQGQLATIALSNLLYTIPAIFGHMLQDTYGVFVRLYTSY